MCIAQSGLSKSNEIASEIAAIVEMYTGVAGIVPDVTSSGRRHSGAASATRPASQNTIPTSIQGRKEL